MNMPPTRSPTTDSADSSPHPVRDPSASSDQSAKSDREKAAEELSLMLSVYSGFPVLNEDIAPNLRLKTLKFFHSCRERMSKLISRLPH